MRAVTCIRRISSDFFIYPPIDEPEISGNPPEEAEELPGEYYGSCNNSHNFFMIPSFIGIESGRILCNNIKKECRPGRDCGLYLILKYYHGEVKERANLL